MCVEETLIKWITSLAGMQMLKTGTVRLQSLYM